MINSIFSFSAKSFFNLCEKRHENKEVIAFVEVKTRKENSLTQPVDAVNRKKQMKIIKNCRI